MAFFTDTASAPKIQRDRVIRKERLSVLAGAIFTGFTRKVSLVTVEHLGLTMAAADSIAIAKYDTHNQTYSKRMNAAGMYKVVVTTDSIGAWS